MAMRYAVKRLCCFELARLAIPQQVRSVGTTINRDLGRS